MNFFYKNRFIFWLLLFLVFINVSALVTFILFYSGQRTQVSGKPGDNSFRVFQKELSLTPSQSEKVCSINSCYRSLSEPVASALKEKREELLDELAVDKPDTTLLKKYAEEISVLQKELQMTSIRQYLDLKGVCDSFQCRKLSSFYFQLYNGDRRGMGKGKKMQNHFRHGQKQTNCDNMNDKDNAKK